MHLTAYEKLKPVTTFHSELFMIKGRISLFFNFLLIFTRLIKILIFCILYFIAWRYKILVPNYSCVFYKRGGGGVSPSYSQTWLVPKKREKTSMTRWNNLLSKVNLKWNIGEMSWKISRIFSSWKMYVIIFKMIHPPHPGIVSRCM